MNKVIKKLYNPKFGVTDNKAYYKYINLTSKAIGQDLSLVLYVITILTV